MNTLSNKPDAPNPAIAAPFQVKRRWRRVGELIVRPSTMRTAVSIVATMVFMSGCGQRNVPVFTFTMPPGVIQTNSPFKISRADQPMVFTVQASDEIRLRWSFMDGFHDPPDILDLSGPSGTFIVRLRPNENEVILNRYSLSSELGALHSPRSEFPGFRRGGQYLVSFGNERIDLRRSDGSSRDGVRAFIRIDVK